MLETLLGFVGSLFALAISGIVWMFIATMIIDIVDENHKKRNRKN